MTGIDAARPAPATAASKDPLSPEPRMAVIMMWTQRCYPRLEEALELIFEFLRLPLPCLFQLLCPELSVQGQPLEALLEALLRQLRLMHLLKGQYLHFLFLDLFQTSLLKSLFFFLS